MEYANEKYKIKKRESESRILRRSALPFLWEDIDIQGYIWYNRTMSFNSEMIFKAMTYDNMEGANEGLYGKSEGL